MRRLESGGFRVEDLEVGGEAPKDFIKIQTAAQRKTTTPPNLWPAYIAKVGHKMYPSESITEQLITRVGQLWGLEMAESELMLCAGQVRFMSRYFLQADEILNHGAEILGGYLADTEFVRGVADQKAEKELFTFQVFCTAIRASFRDEVEQLLRSFVRMIGFDALIGNQDRHAYNWGVISHTTADRAPRFTPTYDTARGLFWNSTESDLVRFADDGALAAYVKRSKPQIGWDGRLTREINHFELVECIGSLDAEYCSDLEALGKTAKARIGACEGMIDAEFADILSRQRRDVIKKCLRRRIDLFTSVFDGAQDA